MRSNRSEEHAPLGIWFKSSYSGSHGECVEVANLANGSAMRDTKRRELGMLTFPGLEWQAFLAGAREVNHPD
ncbi:hypothetical protein GCM10007079_31720 [Nocardiopsis terrae]|uniref:DUF397 domain-containing protein n=1 Tax=Nocardiopsis terrae TaxID=372655 RepID=A0ABR9HIZ6_9ACTN|nr:DUF397 domain-containing protein [Nocardiopsis terrae]MBE1458995.1 hypothetical protein [Nocardiopsis terrae]GHC87498.1 hypothetical protein GCM10007079_31720 [Nocardiopsis terrae]